MIRFWLLSISVLLLLYSCEKEKVTEVLKVEILSPEEGDVFFTGDTVQIKIRIDTLNCAIDPDFIQVDAGQSDKNVRKIGDSDYIWIAPDCAEGYYTISVSVYSTNQHKASAELPVLVRDCSLPVVHTGGVLGFTDSSIRIWGSVISDGGCPIVEKGFYLGFSKHIVYTDSSYFECEITGLSEATYYTWKAYAANDRGESVGATADIQTNHKECIVSVWLDTISFYSITDSSIYAACCVYGFENCDDSFDWGGGYTTIYYSTLPDPGETGQELSIESDVDECNYFLIEGLQPDTDYYVQAYYNNLLGFVHGESEVVVYKTMKSE